MADNDKKISGLNLLGEAAAQDLIPIVDIDQDETKSVRKDYLMGSPGPIGSVNSDTGEFTTITLTTGATVDEISTDVTFASAANDQLATSLAIKTYVNASISTSYHNDLLGLQGGDSTSDEFYHLTQDIHDGLFSGSPIIGLGSQAGTNLQVDYGSDIISLNSAASTVSGTLDIEGHVGVGNGASPFSTITTYIRETYNVSGQTYGAYIRSENTANFDIPFTGTSGLSVVVQQSTSTLHNLITGADITVNVAADGATVTNATSIKGISFVTADNTIITNLIGGDFSVRPATSMSNSVVTNMIAGQFQVLGAGSGDISVENGYGLFVKTPSFNPTGTTENLYGLYIEDQSTVGFTTDYNIYSAGVNSKNRFEGSLILGTDTTGYIEINEFSTDGTLAGNSDTAVPTEQAVKTYVDAQVTATAIVGNEDLSTGDTTAAITFLVAQPDANYGVAWSLVNTTDFPPSIYAGTIYEKTINGFSVIFSGTIDTDNYVLSWIVTR